MYWKIEYMKWDPYKDEGECIGGFDQITEVCHVWDDTLARFIELVKDDNVPQIWVTAYRNCKVYDPDNPFVLTYDAE